MAKYATPEDVAITKAWISITLDGVAGVDQKSNQFWERWVGILRNFHKNNASGCGIDDLERKARLEYSKVSKGKPFINEEVYHFSKPMFPDSIPNAPTISDPRWYEEDGPRRPKGKRDQQREASELSAINDGTDRILKHFSEENAKKMARLDGQEEYLLNIVETNKKSLDLALEKLEFEVLDVEVETLPEWKKQFMLDKKKDFGKTWLSS
ncbi:hypothetical protein C5167_044271 [Papaver somniferum]|uniref:No apical meristem-associated C-terminal domain-containing protein n=1 Tax=Papaver somniferum TaxID=3469 RepID=A0A4Y7LBZ6_PAPSO|nr:hypothetical protein C5167_044271 [Papaver somniferum]